MLIDSKKHDETYQNRIKTRCMLSKLSFKENYLRLLKTRPKSRDRRIPKKVGSWLRSVTQKRNQGRFPVTHGYVLCNRIT